MAYKNGKRYSTSFSSQENAAENHMIALHTHKMARIKKGDSNRVDEEVEKVEAS